MPAPSAVPAAIQQGCSSYTIRDVVEIAEWLDIPQMPRDPSAMRRRLAKLDVLEKGGPGKSLIVPRAALPAEILEGIERHEALEIAKDIEAQLPAVYTPQQAEPELKTETLNDKQRAVMAARLTVITYLNELEANVGEREAVRLFMASQDAGELPERVVAAIRAGNARPKKTWDGKLSKSTLYEWRTKWAEGKAHLATKRRTKAPPPYWGPLLHKIYGRPQKPSIAACLRDWHRHYPDITPPEDWQAQRYFRSLPKLIREWGRHSRNAMRALQPFTRRKTDGLWPMDVVTVDGHLFKAYVKHPEHGKPFRPEVTTYMDVATRRIVGVSLWIAESQYSVWMAMKDMVHTNGCGVPAVHYSDRGAYKGEEHRAIAERLGITVMFAEPHRAQSRGLIERLNRTLWVPMARDFEVYVGKDADREFVKKALKVAHDTGSNLPSWDESIAALHRWKDEYNDRPHRALGGKSPNQAWQEAVDEGWEPTLLDDDQLYDLMPCKERICRRGEVKLPWGTYFAKELQWYDGIRVRVHYEFNTGPVVWVAQMSGDFICAAERDANATPYVSDNAISHAIDKRTLGRLKRIEKKRADILDDGRQTFGDPLLELKTEEMERQSITVDRAALSNPSSNVTPLFDPEDYDANRRHMGRFLDLKAEIEAGRSVDDQDREFFEAFGKTEMCANFQRELDDGYWTREELLRC